MGDSNEILIGLHLLTKTIESLSDKMLFFEREQNSLKNLLTTYVGSVKMCTCSCSVSSFNAADPPPPDPRVLPTAPTAAAQPLRPSPSAPQLSTGPSKVQSNRAASPPPAITLAALVGCPSARKITTRSATKKGKSEVDSQPAITSASTASSVPDPSVGTQTTEIGPKASTSSSYVKRSTTGHTSSTSEPPVNNTSDWKKVTHRSKRRPILRGTAQEHTGLVAVERLKYIHAWRFDASTSTDDIEKFLRNTDNTLKCDIARLPSRSEYASFRIGIPESKFATFMDPNLWPNHISFNEWFFRRSNHTNKP